MVAKHRKKVIYCLAMAFLMVLLSQACGQSFEVKNSLLNAHSNFPQDDPFSPNPGDPAPTPGVCQTNSNTFPLLSSWNGSYPTPVRADDCLSNSTYNLCLTYKDAVSTYGSKFSPAFTPTSATTQQEQKVFVYGVKVPSAGPLVSDHFSLNAGSYATVTPTANGDWKHSYRGDSNHFVAQLHGWYWVNWFRSYLIERTGTFFASANVAKKKLLIRPAANVENNAYFDSWNYSMSIGWSNINQGGNKADLALDVATVLHELGHANYYMANKSSIDGDNKSFSCFQDQTYCCPDKNGCPAAIHEGVADFHAKIAFPDKGGSILDYFFNLPGGDEWRDLDWIEKNKVTAKILYDRNQKGEIHDMGSVYASIWYGVWKKAKASCFEAEIEKLFVEHLAGIGGSDTFITAYTTIVAFANQLFPDKADKIVADFKTEYARMGLTVQ